MEFVVAPIKKHDLGKINSVYLNDETYSMLKLGSNKYIQIDKKYIFKCEPFPDILKSSIALSKIQREFLNKSDHTSKCYVQSYNQKITMIGLLRITVEMLNLEPFEISIKEFIKHFKEKYIEYPFNLKQDLYFFIGAVGFKIKITEICTLDDFDFGILLNQTEIYATSKSQNLTFTEIGGEHFLRTDFNFESLGIGGLEKEFTILFRRAFVQRIFDPEVIQQLGIMHVKGIMLYGPPGTGKTLIARQIGSLLNARPPKIVNGPEILNKYVGQSEENIRNLFKDAEDEYLIKKEKSGLHIIIFDEIDAICKSRGSTNTGVGDQIVNQLLSKMDGVEALDNVLVIGMTNRLDLIDTALLRPGRFEIQIQVSLPDEKGRLEILKIHTKEMGRNSFLEETVDLQEIAKLTKNYTGAELTAIVKSAVSFALERKIQSDKDNKIKAVEQQNIKIAMNDFMDALDEVKPAFGVNEEEFGLYNKVFYETPTFVNTINIGSDFIRKLLKTNLYNTSSLLIHGPPGIGKTTLASKIALKSNCPFVKIISPKNMIGLGEYEKVKYFKERFSDAYKSKESLIILDDLEGLLEYVNIGPRFSNIMLQAIKTLIKTEDRNKLFVIGTACNFNVMIDTGISDCFYGESEVKMVTYDDYLLLCDQNENFKSVGFSGDCAIKNLLGKLESPDTHI